MNNIILIFLLVFFFTTRVDAIGNIATQGGSSDKTQELKPEKRHELSAEIITYIIKKYHYKKIKLDALSSEVLDKYIKHLDPNQNIFHSEDIIEFSKYENKLIQNIQDGNLDMIFSIFNTYRMRIVEHDDYAENMEIQKKILETDAEDIFGLFINTITTTVEPHTIYFSPTDRLPINSEKIYSNLIFENFNYINKKAIPDMGEERPLESEIIDLENGNRIGVLYLYHFYDRIHVNEIKRELEKFNEQNISGLFVDIRGNGGGLLQHAIDVVGLFIEEGPVIQTKDSSGKIEILNIKDSSIVYDGPLVILVDRKTSAAAEVFAAAIQDYKRGLIIGESTFGFGTLRNVIDIGRFVKNSNEKFGSLLMTIAQMFRINGHSIQINGVTPDLLIESEQYSNLYGERFFENAIKPEKLNALMYTIYNDNYNTKLIFGNEEIANILDQIQRIKGVSVH